MAEIVTESNIIGSSGNSYEYVYQTDADGFLTKITQKKMRNSYAAYKSFESVITYAE